MARQIHPTRIRIKSCQVCVLDGLTIPKPEGVLAGLLRCERCEFLLGLTITWSRLKLFKSWIKIFVFCTYRTIELEVILFALYEALVAKEQIFSLIGMCGVKEMATFTFRLPITKQQKQSLFDSKSL